MKPIKNKKHRDPRYFLNEQEEPIEEGDGKERAIRTAWELYAKGQGAPPHDLHPDGAGAEERACKKNRKNKLAKGQKPGRSCDTIPTYFKRQRQAEKK